jgi:sec-independent protein translocase protein TatB
MFDIGWMEMMVIAIVMIVIIGPKELPGVLHTMGRWLARIRQMARSFQDSIEEMAQESGLDEVRREIDSVKHYDIGGSIEKSIDPDGEIRKELTSDGTADSPETTDKATPSQDEKPKNKKRPKADKTEKPKATTTAPKKTKPRAASSDTTATASDDKP